MNRKTGLMISILAAILAGGGRTGGSDSRVGRIVYEKPDTEDK